MTFKEEVYQNFVNDFSLILRNKTKDLEISKLIFLCIGTDRISGDSFGPLVGYKLKNLFYGEKNIEVIGDLENIVNSSNVLKILDKIEKTYEVPFLIAIDAAVSNKKEIGRIVVSNSKMNVGSCFSNKKIYVGDVSIKGIVTKNLGNPKYNFRLLQNVPLNTIMNMADCVSQGICNVINV